MKACAGKFANFAIVTVCSASLLTAFSFIPASCETSHDAVVLDSNSADSADAASPSSNSQSSTNPGSPSSDSQSSPNPGSPSSNSTSLTNPASLPSNSATPLNPAPPQSSAQTDPRSNLSTAKSNNSFLLLIEAVTGKPSPPEIADLLRDVISLKRVGNAVELTKADSSKVIVPENSHFGATVIGGFSEAREKVAGKFGDEVGRLIDEFVGVTSVANHLEVIREGPETEDIDLSERKVKKQLPLRRVRLSKVSMDIEIVDGHPMLKNITGIEAVPNSGLEIPLVLKEFSRTINAQGEDVFNFGIKNPFPLMKPFKRLLGIKPIIPFTWTAKKQTSNEIGAKDPAEHKE
ncbi:MAG TPA: hypothetical protein V6C76_12495 [Drouetiella sp.]